MTKAKALIPYMRKSSGEDPKGSLERQRGIIAAWASREGVELGPEVWEPNVSGRKPWRERGLGAAIEAVRAGQYAGIVAEDQSRLSRATGIQTAEVWEALQGAEARLVLVADGLDTERGDQELNFAIRAALAREQWKQYARRMVAVKERATLEGKAIGSTPFGYRQRGDVGHVVINRKGEEEPDRRLEVDPSRVATVRALFEARARGAGREELAAILDDATRGEVRERLRGGPRSKWSKEGAARMLTHPIYRTGRLEYGGVVSEYDAGAIVDEPLWFAAQRSPGTKRPRNPEWLCSGLAVCGSCGSRLRGSTNRTKYGTYRNYKCRNRDCERRVSVSAARLEPWVVGTLFALIGEDEITYATAAGDSLEPLEVEVERLRSRLDALDTEEARDAMGSRYFAAYKVEREAFEAASEALGAARLNAGEPIPESMRNLRENWESMTPEDRREALALYGVRRVVVGSSEENDWELVLS